MFNEFGIKTDLLSVPEYADEIFANYKKQSNQVLPSNLSNAKPIGKFWMPDANYMIKQTDINEKMRRILIDWLIKVHYKFKLLPETLYLTINIIDRFLSKEIVTRKVLQLIGVTAMHIAWKYEEIYPPEANDFVYITDNAYTKKELLDMEYSILKTLNFDLTFVSAFRFLERFWAITCCEHLQQTAYKHMNNSLVDYSIIKYPPEVLAAGALYLAQAIERKSSQKAFHQNSTHSLTSTHLMMRQRENSSYDSRTNILIKLWKESSSSENEIKKWAIDINIQSKSKPELSE